MEMSEVFMRFQLDLLPNDWVEKLWENSFAKASDLPAEYESYLEEIEICDVLSCASQYLKDWLATPNQLNFQRKISDVVKNNKTWQVLIECKIPHKALLCLLSVFIQKGNSNARKEEARLISLRATSLYFMLLSIPGSHVFQIFNSILYSHAIDTLKMCNLIHSESANKSKTKKTVRKKQDDFSDEDALSDEGDDDHLGTNEKNTLIQVFNLLLSDLIFFLQRYRLQSERDSLMITIQILVLVTRLENNSGSIVLNSPPENTVSALAHKAYTALAMLCTKEHGDIEDIVMLIAKELLSGLLVRNQNLVRNQLQHTGKEAAIIKDHSISFVHSIVTKIKEPTYMGVKALIQQLCVRIPDRAEIRSKNVQVIIELIEPLPQEFFSKIVVWFMGLCHNEEIRNRITGLELVYKVLFLKERPNKSSLPPSMEEQCSTPKFLLSTILSRCKDVSSSVKGKALTLFASAITSDNIDIKEVIETIFIIPHAKSSTIENNNIRETGFFDIHKFILNKDYQSNKHVNPLPGGKAVVDYMKFCIKTDKVLVRKAGLQVLLNILLLSEKWISNDVLQLMVDNCRDMSVSIRKLMIQYFTEILIKYPTHQQVPCYWVRGVLPLLADQELKSQEKVLEALQTTVFDNVWTYNKMCKPSHSIPWNIIPLIIEENMQQEFSFACHKWASTNNNSTSQKLIKIIQTHVGTEHNLSAWYLLFSLSEFIDIKEPRFIMDYFYQNVYNELQVDELCFQLVTETFYLNWEQFTEKNRKRIKGDLLRALKKCVVPLPIIARYMDMVHLITEADTTPPEDARSHVEEWAGTIIEIAEKKLVHRISPDCPLEFEDEATLIRLICILGEAASICPNRLSHETIILIKNLLESKDKEDKGVTRWKGKVSPRVEAVSIITLGKLCLQNQETAKELVPLFAHLMSTTKHPEIKINSMIALTDLCIRFTALVEGHLTDMCICLKDDNVVVREKTLTLLLQLLQEDYLKLRCPLLFHLFSMINDESQKICDKMKSFIISSEVKQKNILLQHFIECIFHYNGYNNHPTFSKSRMSDREQAAFSLSGPFKLEQRRNIYRFMLTHMSDEQRFRTSYALVTDVLDGVLEGVIKVSGNGKPLLQDVFFILSSEDIKLSQMKPRIQDDEEDKIEDEKEAQKKKLNKFAQKTVVSELVKTNVIENIVPTIIKLRQKLAQMKSSLTKDLMLCLRDMMKQYRNEIDEILAVDPELAAEIELDLQNCSEEEDSSTDDSDNQLGDQEILKQVVFHAIMHCEALRGSEVQAVVSKSLKKNKNVCSLPLDLPTPAALNFDESSELSSLPHMMTSLSEPGPSNVDMDVALSPQPGTSSMPEALNPEPESSQSSTVSMVHSRSPEHTSKATRWLAGTLIPQRGTSKSSNLSIPRSLNPEPESSQSSGISKSSHQQSMAKTLSPKSDTSLSPPKSNDERCGTESETDSDDISKSY